MRHAARAHTVTHPAQRDAFETPHPQRQRATRFDVARPAGVSSYVLNGSPKKISPDTAQRVFDAAQRLDYHPNSVARALKTGTTHTLGVIVPDFSNPYFAEFTDQLEAAASKRERALIINLPRGPPHQRTRRAQHRRDVRLLRADRCRTRPLRGQRGARPRAHARRAAHRRRTRHQAVLRMQVTGRQVAANGSQ